MVGMCWDPFGRRNTCTLAPDHHGDRQQSGDAHHQAKNAEGLSRASTVNPISDEECPRETDDGTEARNHNETIAGDSVVGVDDLDEISLDPLG